MLKRLWKDCAPSRRCDWVDQLRGWAVIVMIEVHVVNVFLPQGMVPTWLNFLNGLVAPSFIMCAGYSLVLSTFKTDGTLRPFAPTAKRLGFILLCAYLLHAPGLTLAEWTVLSTPQKFKELFKIDVLQCIAFSLLILQGLARLIKRPMAYSAAALLVALAASLAAPFLWKQGVADGLWLPIRGLINGNVDRGVQSLFPLFPWIAFAAFGSALGGLYRHLRVMPRVEDKSHWSEAQWLTALSTLGLTLLVLGTLLAPTWLKHADFVETECWRLHNTTLPSVAQRLGIVCLAGSLMGWIELFRSRWAGPNWVEAASRESLLLYMLHLNLIFGLILADPIRVRTSWDWHSMGWTGTLVLTALVIGVNLAAALAWQAVRSRGDLAKRIQKGALVALGAYVLLGGWMTYFHFRQSPELAKEPYPFLNTARVRKGLESTPDGLPVDPMEAVREKQRRGMRLREEERRMLESKP